MLMLLLIRIVFFLLALYVGLFSLWRIGEREHVEELPGFLDKIGLSLLVSLVVGRIPSLFSLHQNVTPWALFNPMIGSYSWTVGIAVFFIILFLLTRRNWKDVFSLFDFTVIPLSITIAILVVSELLQFGVAGVSVVDSSVLLFLITRVLSIVTLFGGSKALQYFENHYRTYFWYRYRRNSAQSGFVSAVFCFFFALAMGLRAIGEYPFELLSLPVFHLVTSFLFILTGFVILYVRSGRLR